MDEWLFSTKASSVVAAGAGGVLSTLFVKMPRVKKYTAVLAGMMMSYFIGQPLSDYSGLSAEPTGFLVGFFGYSICKLLFDSIEHSDLSVKFSDIVMFFRRD